MNHIWPPSVMEKHQESKALVILMGIIIYGKWDSFERSEKEREVKKKGCRVRGQ